MFLSGCLGCHLRMKQWLVVLLAKEDTTYVCGQDLNATTKMWTLAKGLMHAERAVGVGQEGCHECHCIDITYFMPRGCSHVPRDGSWGLMPNKPCKKCSECLRCGKKLRRLFGKL